MCSDLGKGFLLVMVKVVSSVAVYVTLESAKVVGDCVSIGVNIDTAL